MDRRLFLSAALALPAAPLLARLPSPPRTRWQVGGSEGYDAIAFLGALSGGELYHRFYAAEADAFAANLPPAVREDIPNLAAEAESSSFGLLWPMLANTLSSARVTTLDSVIALLADPMTRLRPSYAANPSGSEERWDWFAQRAARLLQVFTAMRDADFAALREATLGAGFENRIAEVSRALGDYDVVRWQEKLTGRTFDPVINIVLLAFSRPHAAKMAGQTFVQAADYNTATTVRIAAHEMLHPPFPMDGPAAKAALSVLERDALIVRIVREHDPKWGYTTLEGMLNEDVCQALDQLISEALGVARNPADRWRKADDGIHVLAAGLYGLLRQDGWTETGGDIERWIAQAAADGRLAPEVLHPVAAKVLERPVDALWPIA